VSSGYFPIDSLDPASMSPKANQTSLLVIDLETGRLIREILTSSAPQAATQSFGLSQAIVMDVSSDYVDDVAIAGDLAGNLWRFDLSADDPSDWKVDLMFRTYGDGGAAAVGDQPIASSPTIMADASRRNPVVVFGTGKFIGLPDRSAAIPQQSFYGVADYGTCDAIDNPTACSVYPITADELIVQKITQAGNAVRTIGPSTEPVPATPRGWRIRLDVPSEPGERAYDYPFPFYGPNLVLLPSIIPKGVDPCDPGARYGLMVVNAATGEAPIDPSESSPSRIVGGVVASSTPPGKPIIKRGGGSVVIPGLPDDPAINAAVLNALSAALERADDVWHRGAWREILDQ
jgi:type IV pilus assembly protein PilY1